MGTCLHLVQNLKCPSPPYSKGRVIENKIYQPNFVFIYVWLYGKSFVIVFSFFSFFLKFSRRKKIFFFFFEKRKFKKNMDCLLCSLLKMIEAGQMDHLWRKWTDDKRLCTASSEPLPLDLRNVFMAFVSLAVGFLLVISLFIFEIFLYNHGKKYL